MKTDATRATAVGAMVLFLATAYQLAWWNRYLAPTTGYELMFAGEFARDRLPYRDYYFPVQPGWVFASVVGVEVFGRHLIGFWVLGVLVRLMGVWATYRLVARLCPPAWAGWLTLVAFVASCGDIVDFPPWYNYLTMVFGALAAHAAVRCVEARGRWQFAWAAVAGLWLAVGVGTKQTTGSFVAVAAAASTLLALGWQMNFRRATGIVAVMATIAALPCIVVAAWLVHAGAWPDYVDQIFLRGPAAKGGLGGALGRIVVAATDHPIETPAFFLAAWALALLAWLRFGEGAVALRGFVGSLAGAAIVFAKWRSGSWILSSYTPLLAASALGLIGPLAFAVVAAVAACRGRRDGVTLTTGIAGSVAFAAAFGLALSWPVFPPMALPGFALALAPFLRPGASLPARRAVRLFAVAAGGLLMLAAAVRKYEQPSQWGFWSEPPLSEPAVRPELAELAGFRLSLRTTHFYDAVVAEIRAHSGPADPILVFPNMPLIYGLADRPVATFSYMHWPDVCPDHVAEEDAVRIRKNPPAVIVWLELPEVVWDVLEADFRGGQRCGQRSMLAAMRELTAERYHLASVFPVQKLGENEVVSVHVWVRK